MTDPLLSQETSAHELEGFRLEVRSFLERHIPDDVRRAVRAGCLPTRDQAMRWQRILHERGWGAPAWPLEHGGTGWNLTRQAIFREELTASDALHCDNIGIDTIGPTLIRFGTPQQCQRHLPRMLSFEDYWAQGYSEPEAGSDLASLKTTATRVDDGWVVNGTKIWQSYGHWANRALVLARTDPGAQRRQDGISVLLIDLESPGVTVRPIRLMNGANFHVQIFFDQVHVPAENLVGAPDAGWRVAKGLLVIERLFLARVAECKAELARARTVARGRGPGGGCVLTQQSFALEHARLEVRMRAHEATWWPVVRAAGAMAPVDLEASLLKVQGSELLQDVHQHQIRLLGLDALPFDPDGVAGIASDTPFSADHGENIPLHVWRYRGVTLGGGSSEIQRQIIAKAIFSGTTEIDRPAADEGSEEQKMLVEALQRVFGDLCPLERRRQRIQTGELHDPHLWAMLAELGLPGLLVPEADGGYGGSMSDVVAVAETLGAHLALEPVLWSSVLATRLYLDAQHFPGRAERLESLLSGAAISCFAHFEEAFGHDTPAQVMRAREARAGWRLSGRKRFILGGHAASHLIVSARLPDAGLALFEIPVQTAGVSIRRYRTHDGQGCADLTLDNLALPDEAVMVRGDAARAAIDQTIGLALVGLAADSAGAMRRALSHTVEHLRTRRQFGQRLSEQQVLQHRVVEHFRGWLGVRALVRQTAREWPLTAHEACEQAARAAKALGGEVGKALALDAIQLHGAMGMQDESAISHLAKRLVTNDALFGDTEWQLRQYAESIQRRAAEPDGEDRERQPEPASVS
ncbi:MAG: hypothetical protein RIS35_1196 [Pseudomonadota bacterium]|jgi:acyl-CoA dehydrogenase